VEPGISSKVLRLQKDLSWHSPKCLLGGVNISALLERQILFKLSAISFRNGNKPWQKLKLHADREQRYQAIFSGNGYQRIQNIHHTNEYSYITGIELVLPFN
jgi:hypothetical protein